MNHSTLAKPCILVIDDSEELLEAFKIIFEKLDYEIITKTSADEVSAFVQNSRIDILILDIIFKGKISGRRICKELKSNPLTNYFPIIIMSASPQYLIDFRECDADGFIEKPFTIEVVATKINSLLEHVELKQKRFSE